MNAADVLRMSVSNLARRKVRTALTLVGVIIGVGALVLMISLGVGLKREFLRLFQTDDLLRSLHVSRQGAQEEAPIFGPGIFGGDSRPVTEEDCAELRKMAGVVSVTPEFNLLLTLEIGEKKHPWVEVAGISPEDTKAFADLLVAGKIWSGPEAQECVLPSAFFDRWKQYRPADLIGKSVRLRKSAGGDELPEVTAYTVVGVVDSKKLGLKGARIHAPIEKVLELREETKGGHLPFLYGPDRYPACEVKVAEPKRVPEVAEAVKQKGYSVMTAGDLIDGINTIFLIVEGFLACIGAIGLVVSLFGIANTMAMSVLERTREIGILKALGSRRRDIRTLFLLEAAWIGVLGGAVGLAGGWAFGALLNEVAHAVNVPPHVRLFHVSPWLAGGSVAFSIFVSLVAGVVPALRASRMEPVRALRHEA